jgi:hypothetical protein
MRVAVMTAPGEVDVQDFAEPTILKPTDAVIRLSATCICGPTCGPTEESSQSPPRCRSTRDPSGAARQVVQRAAQSSSRMSL